MKRATIALALMFSLLGASGTPRSAHAGITEEEAHAIAVDAYLYFYPLVTMDVTRKQSTNIEPGKEVGKGPMNAFTNVAEYPPADYKGVVRGELRYPLLHRMARLDQRTDDCFRAEY